MSYPPTRRSRPQALVARQRADALESAATARRARAELKATLKRQGASLKDVLSLASKDKTLGKIKVSALLESLPGIGKVKAAQIMDRLGIAPSRRVQGLNDRLRKALLVEANRMASVRAFGNIRAPKRRTSQPLDVFPIAIFLSDEFGHQQVEKAVEGLLSSTGVRIDHRDDPIFGSWLRRMWGSAVKIAASPAGREALATATHAADVRLSIAQDANVTATMMQNLGPVIAALQPTKDAVIRAGALLILKIDWVIAVHQLTAVQQLKLDHQPDLVTAPRDLLSKLGADVTMVPIGRDQAKVELP